MIGWPRARNEVTLYDSRNGVTDDSPTRTRPDPKATVGDRQHIEKIYTDFNRSYSTCDSSPFDWVLPLDSQRSPSYFNLSQDFGRIFGRLWKLWKGWTQPPYRDSILTCMLWSNPSNPSKPFHFSLSIFSLHFLPPSYSNNDYYKIWLLFFYKYCKVL